MIIDYDKAGRRLHTESMGGAQYAAPTSESSGPGPQIGQTIYQSLYKYTDTGQIQRVSGSTGDVGHELRNTFKQK